MCTVCSSVFSERLDYLLFYLAKILLLRLVCVCTCLRFTVATYWYSSCLAVFTEQAVVTVCLYFLHVSLLLRSHQVYCQAARATATVLSTACTHDNLQLRHGCSLFWVYENTDRFSLTFTSTQPLPFLCPSLSPQLFPLCSIYAVFPSLTWSVLSC